MVCIAIPPDRSVFRPLKDRSLCRATAKHRTRINVAAAAIAYIVVEDAYIYVWSEEWNSKNHLVYWKSFHFGQTNMDHRTVRSLARTAHTYEKISKTVHFLMMQSTATTYTYLHEQRTHTIFHVFCDRFLYFVLFLHLLPPSLLFVERDRPETGRTNDLSANYIHSQLNRHLKRRIKFCLWIPRQRSPCDVSFFAFMQPKPSLNPTAAYEWIAWSNVQIVMPS